MDRPSYKIKMHIQDTFFIKFHILFTFNLSYFHFALMLLSIFILYFWRTYCFKYCPIFFHSRYHMLGIYSLMLLLILFPLNFGLQILGRIFQFYINHDMSRKPLKSHLHTPIGMSFYFTNAFFRITFAICSIFEYDRL